MTVVRSMVLVFNAFTHTLDYGYWRSSVGGQSISQDSPTKLTATAVYGYLAEYPKTRVEVLHA